MTYSSATRTAAKPLKNFWGYNSVSFFALKSGYAADCRNHIDEFKAMVKALHRAGIEVFLDMVFNHSGEGGYEGVTSSFRGIDNRIYYLLDREKHAYLNYSGCGNTLNCNHPVVRDLIRDALRFWVIEMHVDGFRFDLASILGRDKNGNVLANPPMIEMIAEDPVLRNTKIIAEAWDAAGLYQVGPSPRTGAGPNGTAAFAMTSGPSWPVMRIRSPGWPPALPAARTSTRQAAAAL